MQVSEQLEHIVAAQFEKTLDQCSDEEIYGALLQFVIVPIRNRNVSCIIFQRNS